MLSVDEARDAASLLYLGDHMKGHCSLTGGLGSVDLNDPALRDSAQSEGYIKAQGARGNCLNIHLNGRISELHHSSLPVLFLDLQQRRVQRLLLLFNIYTHLISSKLRTFVLAIV